MALLINNDVAERVLAVPEAVDAMADALGQLGRGDAAFQPRTDLLSPVDGDGELDYYWWHSLLGAIRDPPRLAFRFVSDIYSWRRDAEGRLRETQYNVEPGKSMGFVLLFDASTGELLGLLNDEALQHVRVGATAGVACDHLATADASVAGLIGSGGMAQVYLEAFAAVRELTEVRVYSPTRAHREAFAAEMGDRLGIDVTPVGSAQAAVEDADVAATCTNAGEPVFFEDWVAPGMLLVDTKSNEVHPDAAGAFDLTVGTTREPYLASPDYVVGPDELYDRHRELHGRSGFERKTYPTLSEVMAGAVPGRADPDDTIYFHNRSLGIQFAAICDLVLRRAREQDLGTAIPLDWFQQDLDRSYS